MKARNLDRRLRTFTFPGWPHRRIVHVAMPRMALWSPGGSSTWVCYEHGRFAGCARDEAHAIVWIVEGLR